jgi:hypothetical protein
MSLLPDWSAGGVVGLDPLVDPTTQIDERPPEWMMPEIYGDDVPPPLIESQKSRWLATGRGSLAQLSQEAVIDELTDQTRDRGSGETGLPGYLGSAGGAVIGNQLESGAEVDTTGVVSGRLGMTPIALVAVASHLPPPKKVS